MIRTTSFLVLFTCSTSLAMAQAAQQSAPETPPQSPPYRLMGKLHRPLGEVVKVQGKVVEGLDKGLYGGGPNLIVHRINGKATQEFIQIQIFPLFDDFGDKDSKLPELIMESEYEFEGYETGGFVGIPAKAREGRVMQSRGFGFMHKLIVYEGKQIPPLVWSPADFVDRSAVITGRAVSADGRAFIAGKDWRLQLSADDPWPDHFNGKEVEGYGIIRKTDAPDTYTLEDGKTRLVHLKDLLGRKVSLPGKARFGDDRWWLICQGEILAIEKADELPGWSENMHGKLITIDGILEETRLPPLEHPFAEPGDLHPYLIVRNASWKPLKALEEFGSR